MQQTFTQKEFFKNPNLVKFEIETTITVKVMRSACGKYGNIVMSCDATNQFQKDLIADGVSALEDQFSRYGMEAMLKEEQDEIDGIENDDDEEDEDLERFPHSHQKAIEQYNAIKEMKRDLNAPIKIKDIVLPSIHGPFDYFDL